MQPPLTSNLKDYNGPGKHQSVQQQKPIVEANLVPESKKKFHYVLNETKLDTQISLYVILASTSMKLETWEIAKKDIGLYFVHLV